ncbi:hypothetical protein KDA11_03045 [Candidatus Saccharibacteria bacterium]|nr:hypothetical protein [Candidatus Saccharibacteria bacterium]
MPKDNLLHVRAMRAGKTYIGGSFCPDEPDVRAQFESLTPDQAIAINKAKAAVQQGANSLDILEALSQDQSFDRTSAFTLDRQPTTRHKFLYENTARCLARIASGDCLAYPLINSCD